MSIKQRVDINRESQWRFYDDIRFTRKLNDTDECVVYRLPMKQNEVVTFDLHNISGDTCDWNVYGFNAPDNISAPNSPTNVQVGSTLLWTFGGMAVGASAPGYIAAGGGLSDVVVNSGQYDELILTVKNNSGHANITQVVQVGIRVSSLAITKEEMRELLRAQRDGSL